MHWGSRYGSSFSALGTPAQTVLHSSTHYEVSEGQPNKPGTAPVYDVKDGQEMVGLLGPTE